LEVPIRTDRRFDVWYGGLVAKYTTLIDSATLSSLLTSPQVAVVDCRFDLANPAAGTTAYRQAHIPGAVYADLDRDLSGPKTGANGRHPLPSPDALKSTLGRFGIDAGVQVIVYDQDTGMYASRLWWLLRWMGHMAVAVLDGGLAKWTAEQRATRSGTESREPRIFSGTPDASMLVDTMDIPAVAASADARLVDARAPERFRGEVEPIDAVAGRIPGAVNHFYMRNLSEGCFLSPQSLRELWSGTLGDARADRVVCYCGSGVTACHDVLALEHAGLHGARLYPGSWSEWLADPNRPVERG
jgi:thiosulfate/3-mercaptopyruvate sulfurtransferase